MCAAVRAFGGELAFSGIEGHCAFFVRDAVWFFFCFFPTDSRSDSRLLCFNLFVCFAKEP